jgi:hypothetical protein
MQRHAESAGDRRAAHLELAAEALGDGWTRERVIGALSSPIQRDRGYLAYRKACNRHTRYDDQVQQDLQALALANCWLSDESGGGLPRHASGPATPRVSPSARKGRARR